MFSPIIKCQNHDCLYHDNPQPSMFIKKGKGRGLKGKSYQRYQCKGCGTTFSSRSLNWMGDFRKPELVKQVFQFYTSGCSIRRLAEDLHASKTTVMKIVKYLGEACEKYHREYVANGLISTPEVFFDEMETFERAKALPFSIGLAVDTVSKKIIDARVAEIRCKGKLWTNTIRRRAFLPDDYFTRPNNAPAMREEVMGEVKKCLHHDGTIITDDKRAYLTLIRRNFDGKNVFHSHIASRTLLHLHPHPQALGRFNSVCASIRAYMSRMGRRTLITTKSKEMLQAHLYIYIARYNRYDIDEILKQDWFTEDTYDRAMKIGA